MISFQSDDTRIEDIGLNEDLCKSIKAYDPNVLTVGDLRHFLATRKSDGLSKRDWLDFCYHANQPL